MINGINSATSAMSMMRTSTMESHPPPPDKDVFQMADADSDGLVSETELETLVNGIEEITGNSIDLDEALTSSDSDQDGSLSGEELMGLMNSNGFSPPGSLSDEGESGMRQPPPPPSSEQVLSAYAQNTGEDNIDQLIQFLKNQNGSNDEFSSFDVTT